MDILRGFPDSGKFVNKVLKILWFGCFVTEGVLHLLRDYILADAEVWEAGLKARMILQFEITWRQGYWDMRLSQSMFNRSWIDNW